MVFLWFPFKTYQKDEPAPQKGRADANTSDFQPSDGPSDEVRLPCHLRAPQAAALVASLRAGHRGDVRGIAGKCTGRAHLGASVALGPLVCMCVCVCVRARFADKCVRVCFAVGVVG